METGNVSPTRPTASRAVAWTLAARQGERLLGIVSITILARLLSPSDFGLVAMAGSIAAIVEVLSAFGFDWALVRLPHPTREHYDTAWTLRVICGVLVLVALSAAAYPAAIFFSRTAVMPIVIVMGVNGLIGSVENIWMTEFRRQNRFDQEFKLRMFAKTAGFAAATTLAFYTRSYWALVVGVTSARLAATALSYRLHRSRPRWDLSRQADLLRFSVWLLIGNVTEEMRNRFAEIWIGRNLGPREVGLYSMASELSALASTELAAPVNRAVFAKYTQLNGDVAALREGYLRVSGLIWSLGIPAAVGIGICAPQIVAILLGRQWTDAAQVLQILAAAGVINIVTANTQYVYWALGRSRFVTLLSIADAVGFVVITLILGWKYGVMGVAWAQVAASALVLVINFSVLTETLDMDFLEIFARNYRVVLASAATGGVVIAMQDAMGRIPSLAIGSRLSIMVGSGVIGYFVILLGLWHLIGKPSGPEEDIWGLFVGAVRRIAAH